MTNEDKKDKCSKISSIMSEFGITPEDMIDFQIANERSMFSMSPNTLKKYNGYFSELEKPQKCAKDKGNVLENLACCLMFSEFPLFEIRRNISTSSNEIDILVNLTDKGKCVVPRHYAYLGEQFLCECKNYCKSLDVTYVGKFYSLLKCANAKVGILFTVNGVTGYDKWNASGAFIRKVALKENIAILVFNKSDYEELKDNKNSFLSTLDCKYKSLMNDISYKEYVSKHQSEDILKNSNNV